MSIIIVTDIFNPLTLDSNLISPYNITAESNIEVVRIKEMIIMHAVEEVLIIKEILFVSTLGSV